MELQIIAKNVEISQQIEDYIQKKIGKLSRYLPNLTEAKVEVREESTRSPRHRFTVQVTLNNKGILLRGEERAESVYVAVDAVDKVLARQIERYKGKSYSKGRSASRTRQSAASKGAITNEKARSLPNVIKVKHFVVKPMSVTDAAEQMELLGHDFFLFINDSSDMFSLLYRRRDGNYGLIEPELA